MLLTILNKTVYTSDTFTDKHVLFSTKSVKMTPVVCGNEATFAREVR